jgi:pyridoxine 5-phosphate synthase
MTKLGVNIDHIATIRQARRAPEPDPVAAAVLAELAGADGITVHLRGDRRHIQDRDVRLLRETIKTRLNIEMAVTNEMIGLALEYKPETVTLVPERDEEVTTEGGLDVVNHLKSIKSAVSKLHTNGIEVSLFIDPAEEQVRKAVETGAGLVEFNTSAYSEAVPLGLKEGDPAFEAELQKLFDISDFGAERGLRILAGHGLTYRNVGPVSSIPEVEELNIGHNIVARASLVGMERAVREMLAAMNTYDW